MASSTLNNENNRLILGDEPLQSQTNTARNSISSRNQAGENSNTNYCYSSSANSSIHNLNGHTKDEKTENGKSPVMQRLSSNDENEHRTNLSATSLNESAVSYFKDNFDYFQAILS